MFRRHVDFIAVFMISLGLVALSKASDLRLPDGLDPVRLQNAVNVERCPVSTEILSRLSYILNR